MQDKTEIEIFYPTSQTAWRTWLIENHESKQAVWLVFYNKSSDKPTISWSNAVDEALCFGWIDSKRIAIDTEKSHQFFSKRKPKSTWSRVNKVKIEQLTANGLIMKAGLDCVEIAKLNGSWSILDDVEALIIPEDFEIALRNKSEALDFFLSLSKSVRKVMLHWLVLAKRPETRQKRIDELVELAEKKQKKVW